MARAITLQVVTAAMILLPTAAAPLLAGQGGASTTITNKSGVGGAELSASEEALIRSYFDVNPGALGEVAALSPGIRAKLAPGAPLPLIRTRQALPADLDAGLAPHPGLDFQVIGRDIVLFDTASRRIIAVLKDVLKDPPPGG